MNLSHPDDEAGIVNPANIFTIARVPAGIYGIMKFDEGLLGLGVAIIVAAFLSDFFDGVVARVFHCRTKLGALLDPIADKILMAIVGIYLLVKTADNEPAAFTLLALIMAYEIIVAVWTVSLQATGFALTTTYIGKKSMFARMTAFGGILFHLADFGQAWLTWALIVGYFGLLIGCFAFAQYVQQGRNQLAHGTSERWELWPYGYNTATSRFLADPFGLKEKLGIRIRF